jgi:hypothetical protein
LLRDGVSELHTKDGSGAGKTREIGDENRAAVLLAAGFISVLQNTSNKIVKLVQLLRGERKRGLRGVRWRSAKSGRRKLSEKCGECEKKPKPRDGTGEKHGFSYFKKCNFTH